MAKTTKKPTPRARPQKALAAALEKARVSVDRGNAGIPVNMGMNPAKTGSELHNTEVLTNVDPCIMSNPRGYIDEINKYSPFWGDIALRVLTSNIGWSAVSAILWDLRKRNKAPKTTSGIEWLNETLAEAAETQENVKNIEEQGMTALQFVDGLKYTGVYKQLFMELSATQKPGDTMELPSPAVLYDRMKQNQQDRDETLAAYDQFAMEHFKKSPNYKYAKAKLEAKKLVQDARAVVKAQDELDHIHLELRSVRPEPLTDAIWHSMPLWAQYKALRSIYNQVVSAMIAEDEKPADERLHREELDNIGKTVLLELESAARTAEVKLAFEKDVLKDRHELLKDEAPVETVTA